MLILKASFDSISAFNIQLFARLPRRNARILAGFTHNFSARSHYVRYFADFRAPLDLAANAPGKKC
jgi:hypothetical protein